MNTKQEKEIWVGMVKDYYHARKRIVLLKATIKYLQEDIDAYEKDIEFYKEALGLS